jgi:hypothetical protein
MGSWNEWPLAASGPLAIESIMQQSEQNQDNWPLNYFNYFTEIEEHFQRSRGTGLFLLSPLDWALIESWKNAGIPLAAVIRGIDEAFQKWHSRKVKRRMVNSVAYCAQAVLEAAQRTPENAPQGPKSNAEPPFSLDELKAYLGKAAGQLRQKPEAVFQELAASLENLLGNIEAHMKDLEDLERRLTAMEDKMVASARSLHSDSDLYAIRQSLDSELKPYRGKMTADQLAMLERRYLDTALIERSNLPRLSLFYLH